MYREYKIYGTRVVQLMLHRIFTYYNNYVAALQLSREIPWTDIGISGTSDVAAKPRPMHVTLYACAE